MSEPTKQSFIHELGVVGNVWVRQNVLVGKGFETHRHKHHFDHVSLLTTGEVEVSVEGFEPKVFKAPTFIVIKAEHRHSFKALSDDVVWYCVFALRDEDGGQTDLWDGRHSPYGQINSEGFDPAALADLESKTTQHDES